MELCKCSLAPLDGTREEGAHKSAGGQAPGSRLVGTKGMECKSRIKGIRHQKKKKKKKFLESLAFQSIKTRFHYLEIINIVNGITGTWRQWVSWSQENKIPGILYPSPLGLTEPANVCLQNVLFPKHCTSNAKFVASSDPTHFHAQGVSLLIYLAFSLTASLLLFRDSACSLPAASLKSTLDFSEKRSSIKLMNINKYASQILK